MPMFDQLWLLLSKHVREKFHGGIFEFSCEQLLTSDMLNYFSYNMNASIKI